MGSKDALTIQEVRSFSRFYTNVLGLLNKHILDSAYSLTEVRILLEIDKTSDCTANVLIEKLNIDRGYMSRILKRFEADQFIKKESSPADRRVVFLKLTPKGKETLSDLEGKSDIQVQKLVHHLTDAEQDKLINAMQYITKTLSPAPEPIIIRTFQPKDIDYIIKRHRELYEVEYGFSRDFGDYVDEAVHKFAASYDPNFENIWIAEVNETVAGVIALVKVDAVTAQLRWFLIEPQLRGMGLGHQLMTTLIEFCREKQYKHVFLWTVHLLEAARHLYKKYGFELTEIHENNNWCSQPIKEERWDLHL